MLVLFSDRCRAYLKIALGAPPRRAAEMDLRTLILAILKLFPHLCCACLKIVRRTAEHRLRTLILCHSEAISGLLLRLSDNRPGGASL